MNVETSTETPLRDPGRRPRNPVVSRHVVETVERITTEAGFWPAAQLADALKWHVEDLTRLAGSNVRLKRLKRRADATCAARLQEVLVRKGLLGDKNAAAAALKNLFSWTPGRDAGGLKLPAQAQSAAAAAIFEGL